MTKQELLTMRNAQELGEIYTEKAALVRLNELELDAAWLTDAILQGVAQGRATASELDPPQFAGLLRYILMNRALREAAGLNGWSAVNGLPPSIRAPKGTHALVHYFGDAGTGVRDAHPSNLYGKGPSLAALLAQNQLSLFPQEQPEPDPEPEIPTWVFLISQTPNELRAEVSLPRESDANGFIVNWAERVLLPAIPLADPGPARPAEPSPVIDVPVRRRR